ncbi:MAG: hypothetical protein LAT82_00990 [Nanoarchaeota archaeon]|nr:hypothetical protein [Nanoarchaeota archaeon]
MPVNKIKLIILPLMLIISFLITGCVAQNIEEIKHEDNIGKTVTVKGTVSNSIKIGELSGYLITDNKGDTIAISSDSIPENGEELRVSGTLMRDTIFGYYIKN